MLFERCAKIPGSISGGPRDETPPLFLYSNPFNYATDFNAQVKERRRGVRRIEITFDEFLQLKDMNNQFYSSPPMKKKPEILLYGKTIRLNLQEPLLPDITYIFDFGDAITDLNEGNVTTDFSYVFSTGIHIDSLTFTGRALNAYNMRPNGKDDRLPTWVMLYDDLSDSVVYKQPPTYIARTDDMGFFTFSHIRPDTFLIFVLRDMGANLIFDTQNEQIAFSDTLIVVDRRHYHSLSDSMFFTSRNTPDSIKEKIPEMIHTDIVLYQFEEAPTRQFRRAYERKEANLMSFIYNLPVDSFEIEILDYEPTMKWYEMEMSANRDTLNYWLTDTILVNQRTLTVHIHSPSTDSLNNLTYISDTLRLNYEPPRQAATTRRRDRRNEEDAPRARTPVETMSITTSVRNNGTMELTDRMTLTSSQPIGNIDPSKIIFQEEVDTLKRPVAFSFTRDSANIRKAFIDWNIKEDTRYFLTIDSMSFTSVYNVFNDSTGISFRTRDEAYYSSIEITFDSIPCPLIVQILRGEREDLVKQTILTDRNVTTIDFLRPDTYKIKVIYDRNGNGQWDTGNYIKKIQPEKVEYYDEPEVTTESSEKTELRWQLKNY